MTIHGLTVCVDYADHLAKGIGRWVGALSSLTVVTAHHDQDTVNLAHLYGASVVQTDVFYSRGAHFNKGAALAEAWDMAPLDGWVLLFDADMEPERDWLRVVSEARPEPGWLYGAWRWDPHGRRLPDDCHGYGYFQLLHTSDPLFQQPGLFETHWTHAGNYDSAIMLRWRNAGRLAPPLPVRLTHHGDLHNWFGRGRQEPFEQMIQDRRRYRTFERERLP